MIYIHNIYKYLALFAGYGLGMSQMAGDLAFSLETDFVFALGNKSVCIGDSNGNLKCFGLNNVAQLGQGHTSNLGDDPNEMGSNLPFVNLGSNLKVKSLDCGGSHCCALFRSINGVKCWGSNEKGRCGLGIADAIVGSSPEEMGNNLPFLNLGSDGAVPVQLALGSSHTCIRFDNGQIKCFGEGIGGKLGYGDIVNRGGLSSDMGDNLQYVNIGPNTNASTIVSSSTSNHNCIIISSPIEVAQRMKCWGLNHNYQLGYGDVTTFMLHFGDQENEMGHNLPFVELGEESRVKAIGMGELHTCAITINDLLKCWGGNKYGQLGVGTTFSVDSTGYGLGTTIVDSGNLLPVMVSGGNAHTCVLLNDKFTLKCVGQNIFGQLGQGDKSNRGVSPSNTIDNITTIDLGIDDLEIRYVKAGNDFTCVAFVDNTVKCFGDGADGQLGQGNRNNIGDDPNEMGTNLTFVDIFGSASSLAPTKAPTTAVVAYVPPKQDCYMITDQTKCEVEENGHCGSCLYFSNRVYYGLKVRIDFVMEGSRRFSEFESTLPPITTFRDAIKALLVANLDGEERISINRISQIYQPTGSKSGYVEYELGFIDNQSSKEAAKTYFSSNPNGKEYVNELNTELNKKMKTSGQKYITGSIRINSLNIIDRDNGNGACGCPSDVSSNGMKSIATASTIMITALIFFIL